MSVTRHIRQAVRRLQTVVPDAPGGVTVLAFHLVGAATGTVVDLSLAAFERQLAWLQANARVESLDDALVRLAGGGGGGGASSVVLTFDDAFDNFAQVAWPVLERLGLPCTLYAPVGFLDGVCGSPLTGASLPPIGWDTLCSLAASELLTVGSHSYAHVDVRGLSASALRTDLERSRDTLQDRLGVAVEHFCYPQAKWSRAVEGEVGRVYRTAAIAGGKKNAARSFRPLRLGRVPIRADMDSVGQLASVVGSRVWLEEWIASNVRMLARRERHGRETI